MMAFLFDLSLANKALSFIPGIVFVLFRRLTLEFEKHLKKVESREKEIVLL